MREFTFELSDGKKIAKKIEVIDKADAMNIALTALAAHSSSTFPPPEHIEIKISDEHDRHVATMRFMYQIEYAPDPEPDVTTLKAVH